ncbi:MAG TPA: alpha/beta hydrolase [Myxococcota bacterium]|jgi:pimeloyl-ACP methyl ester carboxylesterase|nr:alpha/beta hydrolase [Myxococcota bacterium]
MLDPSLRHEEVHANGLRFHVLAAGAGDRLAICLHGFPELAFSWRHQLPLLAELGYRAWAPDLRGYGKTDRPLGLQAYAIETLLDDVAGLIDASGAKETVLIAHDWGGVIAWYFALRRIRPLSRLVVMNLPHPAVFQRVLESGWRQRLRSWYVLFFQIPWLPEALLGARRAQAIVDVFRNMAIDKSRFPDEVLEVYRRAALEPGALTAMVNYYRALVRGGGAERQRSLGFPRIDVPVLLVWGEHDSALGKELTIGTEQHVSDFTLRLLPNASHWVQQDAPDEVNAILREWLGGARPSRT